VTYLNIIVIENTNTYLTYFGLAPNISHAQFTQTLGFKYEQYIGNHKMIMICPNVFRALVLDYAIDMKAMCGHTY
jgi:hypothetical protein